MGLSFKRCWVFLPVLLLVYAPVLFHPSPVDPDALLILPVLQKSLASGNYLRDLLSFETLDLQPVRDLSFMLDLLVFRLTGLNSLVFFNLLIWLLGGLALGRILRRNLPELSEQWIFFLVLGFLVYPLFTPSVSWGMARKHLLASTFILFATSAWPTHPRRAGLFYCLSVLGQPITLLWPLWTVAREPRGWKRWSPLLALMGVFAVLNTLYYERSQTFRHLYGSKTNELLNLPEKILALGHYAFNLLFPYQLTFTSQLGHWSALVGLALMVGLLLWLLRERPERWRIFPWIVFMASPVAVVLLKASFLYDTYLLVPGAGLFILVAIKAQNFLAEKDPRLFMMLIFLWGGYSFSEAQLWRDETELTAVSFERRPSCKSAVQHLRSSYELGHRPRSEARRYLKDYQCQDQNLNLSQTQLINLMASSLFYEDEGTPEDRVLMLKKLSVRGIYPQMVLAAYFVRAGKTEEAEAILREMISKWGSHRFLNEYVPLADEVLRPFCEARGHSECLRLIDPFVHKGSVFSFQ